MERRLEFIRRKCVDYNYYQSEEEWKDSDQRLVGGTRRSQYAALHSFTTCSYFLHLSKHRFSSLASSTFCDTSFTSTSRSPLEHLRQLSQFPSTLTSLINLPYSPHRTIERTRTSLSSSRSIHRRMVKFLRTIDSDPTEVLRCE